MYQRGITRVVSSIFAPVILLAAVVLPNGYAQTPSAERQGSEAQNSRNKCGAADFRFDSVLLKRRNWENHGTDIHIATDGRYVVTAQFLGHSKKVREGGLSPGQVRRLSTEIHCSHIFSLTDEYRGPFRSEWFWWGYELSIRTEEGSKTIRFHSEDETAPRGLHKIVELVMDLTK